ncbi:multidrug efflux MFS transporter [Paraburkholderia caballeronis]|uniref:Predicted arabinose efflux permease, MFS family n=1 Tax=Paraburkholderia caballeronis TaxID=416943 RepID=A0A1H7P3W8_9BURK|nr:multidrug efflux MFS transporter [Paraburkholderia caballeronis]PXW25412.1 putative MFS family arabinose efflux permease [Paraburkholderia caballeronis]PXX01019.1 putative MFS family arabinose efflux permease [Paraburkholderia caballeronis]RAJ99628.1 putative MFS family arabinose efflux permease [Paraburkholderia caballeronis]TDV34054.1 putative MFS family arabinose efflux permease [Paraburkholderia caballeronis]SEE38521.1 Predicted arabinose efflux permease, MFS family [Paraburkholderia ca
MNTRVEETVSPHDSVNRHWQRNLVVCLFGSFTTIVAMTVMLPFLPLYVEELGVHGHAAIVQWSGIAYSAAFFTAALVAPLWGRLGDRYGRKPMLVRASLGMALTMSLIGMSRNIWQLVALRLVVGFAGGYSSGSTILVATQTPRDRSAWALGVLSSGIMAGNLIGPLVGGSLPPLIGIRGTFWLAGGVIFIAFVATCLLVKEEPRRQSITTRAAGRWAAIPDKRPVVAMLATGLLLMLANMSIEPIITVYVATLVDRPERVTIVAGFAMSAAALGSILSASRLGRLADRIGHGRVIVGAMGVAALLLVPQAFVTAGWQLVALRFLMGVALGGLLPCIAAVIRHNTPDQIAGSVLGYSVSAQFAGQVLGPLAGGFVGGHLGMRAVFLGTSVLMLAGAAYTWRALGLRRGHG